MTDDDHVFKALADPTPAGVSGAGWTGVISALKTLLETGKPLYG